MNSDKKVQDKKWYIQGWYHDGLLLITQFSGLNDARFTILDDGIYIWISDDNAIYQVPRNWIII